MEFRVLSDLHIDQRQINFRSFVSPSDKEKGLIIAGDICSINKHSLIKETLSFFAVHFKCVIFTLGNHEYSFNHLLRVPRRMRQLINSLNKENIYLLHNSSLFIEGTLILGTTLWSDLSIHKARLIKKPHEKLTPFFSRPNFNVNPKKCFTVMNTLHQEQKNWLFNQLKESKKKVKKTLVISHHAPSFKSAHPNFINYQDQFFYASNLEEEIKQTPPTVWIHGHTHYHCDYLIGQTRILSNPLGLPSEQTGFNPNLSFTI